MKPVSSVAVLLFSIVAVAHLLRLVFQVDILIGGARVPMWASVVGLVVPAALAVALWREAHSSGS